jgi:hypothetical protein
MTSTHRFDKFEDTNSLNRFAGTLLRFDKEHSLRLYDSTYVKCCNDAHSAKLKSYRINNLDTGTPNEFLNIQNVTVKEETVGMFLGVDDYVLNNNLLWERKDFAMFMVLKFLVDDKVLSWNIYDAGLVSGIQAYIESQQTFDYRLVCSKFPFWWNNRVFLSDEDADARAFIRYLERIGFIVSNVRGLENSHDHR